MGAVSAAWLSNPWLVWGLGPGIASVLGFLVPATVLELIVRSGVVDSFLLSYTSSKDQPRKTLLADTYKRIPFK